MKVKKRLDIQIYIIALSLMMAWTTVPGLVKEVISKETTAPGQSSDTLEKDQQLHDKMSRLRIPFIANEGQIKDDLIKYYARTFGGTIYVTEKGEIVYSLPGIASDESTDPLDKAQEDKNMEIWVLRENLIGAYEIHPEGMDKARTKVNSFIGSDKNRWKTNISTYNNLSLGRVYDGIDLALKAYGNNVEKVFTVYPTGEVSDIELKMDGASSMSINHDGELELETDLGPVRFSRPVAYQEIAGEREPVEVAYNIKGTTYGFQVAEYNNDYPLIIDPLLASTFIGGTSLDAGNSIALDSSGNIYVTGITQSSDYPATSGAYDEANNGGTYDVFVSKLTSDLTTLSASTFIGGGDYDYSFSIALDSANNVYITGYTESSDYPTTSGAYDEAHNGDSDVFVSKLTSDLTTLSASTFIGGSMSDRGHFFALDSSNNVYVTGYTYSWDYPTTSGAYDEVYNASYDVFISKLTSDLATLSASTFIGGGTGSDVGYSIALDDSNNVYVTGDTDSSDYPITSGAYDETSNGSKDVFVSKLTADLATLSASTFIGGSSDDEYCRSIALDSSDNVYVIGNTDSSDYPTTSGAYDETFNGGSDDVFVSKLTADLATLSASTYIGGASLEDNRSLALDGSDNVYVTGQTESSDYPTTSGAYDEDHTGVYYDAFISKLTSNLTTLSASTFIGGAGYDYARAIALDSSGNVYVTGMTESSDYAVTSGAYDEIFNGGYDVFVSKLSGDLSGEPGVVFVNGDNTGTEDGDSWDTGYSTIQAGIDAAVAGDEIWVKQGTYQESIGLVENNVSLYGGFDGTETLRDERDWINNITTIDGMTESGVIQNYSTGIVLDGFTITNGNATASSGGGIYNDYGEIIIQNCTFYGNYASGNGGAIYNYGSDGSDASVTLIDCVFDNNSAGSYGGAIYNYYSMVNMTGCTFQNNSVTTDYSYGGAVYNMSANNTITNCTFENNSAVDYGGAFYNRDSDISITGSSFTENVTTNASAGSGGAIYNYRSSPVITDCSFTRNSTGNSGTIHGNIDDILGYSGGAIFYYYSTSGTEVAVPNITNCTFEENEAQYGGAIGYEYDSSDTNLPTASITNCRFINNWAPFYSGAISIIDIGSGDYGEPEIINCLFTGNVSDIGGVSRNQDGEPLFLNCTFSGNTTNNTTYGSTIENSGAGQIARFINCIFWGNSTANGQEIYNEGTVAPATPVISYSNIEGSGGSSAWDTNLGTDGENNIDADPLFVSASDYHLQAGSPSIDTGDNSQTSLPATDIEGNTRIQNSIVDMGPYEYEYVLQQYSLTMQVSGSGSTTPSAGTYAYDSGTNVDLEAIPDTGYEFAGWSGDLEGTTNPTTITVDSDKTVTANFILMTHSLSVNIVGSGSVSLDPTGGSYDYGAVVTVTATPNTGYEFTGWSGDLTGTTNPTTITMDWDKTITATFAEVDEVSFLPALYYMVGNGPMSIATGDLNGDGRHDIATANRYSNDISVLLGNGDGTFEAAVNYTVGDSPYSVAIGDFDDDGDYDISTANYESGNISVLLGNGDGTFNAAVNYNVGDYSFSIAIGDLNGDGDLDIATANASYDNISVLLGNGDGTFQDAVNYTEADSSRSIAISDLNGDGNPDIATADYSSGNVSVLLGNGDGTFETAVNYAAGVTAQSIAIGDLNGDGNPDIAVANLTYYYVSVLLGNGDGTFQDAVNYAASWPTSIAIDDLNNDGDSDIAFTNSDPDNVSVLLGNGDGSFQTVLNFSAGDGLSFLVTCDFNGDGKRDIATANVYSDDVSILLNNTDNIEIVYDLIVTPTSGGSVTISPGGGSYNSGTEVTLTANPETGWQFTGWSGDLTGTTNPTTITMDSYKTVTATFIQVASNNPPSAPTAVTPEDEAIMESGAVMISASDFTDSDVDDTHMESYWMVRRADSVYGRWDYDESFDYAAFEETSDDLTTHTLEGLLTGMKYIWKVGYTDSGGETPVWSEEYSFKVGTSVSESMPEVYSGIDIADFTIMSFPFWLDDPSALVVFDIDYDTRYFRIGRYVPDRNGGEYVELDDPSAELNPGEAVWILARDGLEVVVDGIPVSVETDIEVALYYNEENGNGWNQIGCPNARNYPWAELEVTEYNEYGDIVFGPTPLGELDDPNDHMDLRVWRWVDGDYESFTPDDDFILEVYEGYWVKVKRDNIYLKFPEASQIAGLTNNDTMFAGLFKSGKKWVKDWILTSPVAVADSGDSPPMPMGGFTSESGAEASGEGGGGGCFIATAAYGSPMERHVRILREFRDKVLLSSGAGIRLVNLYYRHSPPLADYVAAHDGLRSAVRVGLLPLVGMGYLALNHPILLFLVLFASCLSFVYVLAGIYRGYANIN